MTKTTKTKEEHVLAVTARTILGKKLKNLRKEGLVPANIFGTGFKSTAISIPLIDFVQTYRIVRETGVVFIKLGTDSIPVLIQHIQRHPLKGSILHVDLRKIDLSKKVETEVPVKIIGVSEAVAQKGGVLLTQTEKLLIEALPQSIPQHIEVDISIIKEIGQSIKVSDLAVSKDYTVKTEADRVIVSVTAHKEESIIAETTTTEAPEVITAKPEEGAEGEGTAEAGKPAAAADKKEEVKK